MTILFANNALSTLAGSISDTATSVTLAPGSGVKFPNPTGGDYFNLTFTDVATGLLNEIVHVTARSGDVLTIVRAQEGTTALAWAAGDLASGLITAGALTAMLQSAYARISFTADTTFYVTATGNDTTGDGSVGSPWLTIQHAIDVISQNYDLKGFVCTVSVGAGTFAGFSITAPFVGASGIDSFVIQGASAATTILSSQAEIINAAACTINGLTFCGGGITSFLVANGAICGLATSSAVTFQSNATGIHMYAGDSGVIFVKGSYNITGGAAIHMQSLRLGNINFGVGTCTVTGTPAFSAAFAFSSINSCLQVVGGAFSGAATGVRYSATLNATINTGGGGANFFPGNSAGSTATGGQYA